MNHRFWCEGEWKSAGTLEDGDILTLADGSEAIVTEVTFEETHTTVYNMEVADYHTYYVGEDSVWVHNNTQECTVGGLFDGKKTQSGSEVVGETSYRKSSGKLKTGPKPKGTGPHNLKIEEVASQVKDGKVIAGGGMYKERAIPTPNGIKKSRRPDILVERPDGSLYGINVGRTTARGAPIKREVEAIYDLEDAGIPMWFVNYD